MTSSDTNPNVRRTTWILAAIATAFYLGFILIGVTQA